jgi:hypothetical protein
MFVRGGVFSKQEKEKDNTERASLSIENRSLAPSKTGALLALHRKSRAQPTLSNPESLALYRKLESILISSKNPALYQVEKLPDVPRRDPA